MPVTFDVFLQSVSGVECRIEIVDVVVDRAPYLDEKNDGASSDRSMVH